MCHRKTDLLTLKIMTPVRDNIRDMEVFAHAQGLFIRIRIIKSPVVHGPLVLRNFDAKTWQFAFWKQTNKQTNKQTKTNKQKTKTKKRKTKQTKKQPKTTTTTTTVSDILSPNRLFPQAFTVKFFFPICMWFCQLFQRLIIPKAKVHNHCDALKLSKLHYHKWLWIWFVDQKIKWDLSIQI